MKRLSVSIKLLAAFMGLTLIAVSLGLYAVWSLFGMRQIAVDTYDKPLMATSFARAAALDAERLQRSVEDYAEARPGKVSMLGVPGRYDPVVTASLGPKTAASMSERERLISLARSAGAMSERQRLIAKAGGTSTVARQPSNPFSERQALIHATRKNPLASERQMLVAAARKTAVVAKAPVQIARSPATATDAASDTLPAVAAPKDTAAQATVQKPAADRAVPKSPQEETVAQGQPISGADLEALREKIIEEHELLIENLEVVEERAFTSEIMSGVENAMSLAASWAERNKPLFKGEPGATVAGREQLGQLLAGIEALVEQTVTDGFEFRAQANQRAETETNVLIVLIGLSVVLALAMAYATARFVVAPLKKAISAIGALADGDLTVELEVKSKDEVGDLANAVTILRSNLKEREDLQAAIESEEERNKLARTKARQELADRFKARFEEVVDNITTRMQELQATAQSLTSNAEDATGRAGQATQSTGDTANNVQNVASATQELSASIGEIEQKVAETTKMVSATAETANTSDAKIGGLVEAVDKIGSVVGLIRDVTEQTNLLALNATIEAARAGEAGKGFAVVAQEVKTLAGQTARATEEIVQQIQAIQGSTTEAADAIRLVTDSVKQISDYTSGIAVAVEQQTAATREIAQSVEMAANGTNDTSQSMDSLLKSTNETAQSANTVSEASEMATADAIRLKDAVDDFVKELVAA